MIILFILGLLINGISGIKNSFFYAKDKENSLAFTAILFILLALSSYTIGHYMFDIAKIQSIHISLTIILLWYIFNSIMLFACGFMGYMFTTGNTNKGTRIHLWEGIMQYSWFILMALSGMDLMTLLCISFAGNVVFNIPIQLESTGRGINVVSRTDDPTGKTEGIYIFGLKINKPRISNGYVMLTVGIIATIWFLIYTYQLHLSCTIYSIIDWLKVKNII